MADILDMQSVFEDAPEEEKGSYVSISLCHNSFQSWFGCFVK